MGNDNDIIIGIIMCATGALRGYEPLYGSSSIVQGTVHKKGEH